MKYRHKKTGRLYEVVAENASLQCSSAREFEHQFDDEDFVIYRNVATGTWHIRPYGEFFDGRFVAEDEG